MSPHRVTIVGSGLTGALTAYRLKKTLQEDVAVTILEKSRGAGGRMSTSRSANDPHLTCDLGAQYISATPEYEEKHKEYYSELITAGIIKEFSGKIVGPNRFGGSSKHFIAPQGINTVVKHFLNKSGVSPFYGKTVENVDLKREDQSFVLHVKENCEEVNTDHLVFTIPVPQLLKLQGNIQGLLEPFGEDLRRVEYSSRYAMALFFNGESPPDVPWDCNYVSDNDCIRFIGIDNAKRGTGFENGYSMVVHTSVPFGIQNLEESFDQLEPIVMKNLRKIFPSLPQPTSSKFQRWRYSQTHKPYPGSPGSLVLHSSPLLIAGGDSFGQSTFDGCIDSSAAIVDNITKLIERGCK